MRSHRTIGLVVAAATLTGCLLRVDTDPPLLGSGRVIEQPRTVAAFTTVAARDVVATTITVSAAQSVRVVGDDNLVPWITTTVRDGQLTVGVEGGRAYYSPAGLRVYVTTPRLAGVEASAASELDVYGVGEAAFAVIASGASRVTARGATRWLSLDVSGASLAHASALTAEVVAADLTGASVAWAHATKEVYGTLSGASRLYVTGAPPVRAVFATGGSRVVFP